MLFLHSVIRHLVHMIEQAQKELQKLRWVILIYIHDVCSTQNSVFGLFEPLLWICGILSQM